MMIVPAVFLGGVAVGAVVYFVTVAIRCGIEDLRWRLDPGRQKNEIGNDLDPVGLVLGLVAVGLLVLSFFLIPREWVAVLWTALTVIGILVGISTFFLFGSQDEPSSRQVYRQTRSTSLRSRSVDRSRPATPKRVPPRPREDPYRELLARVLNDRGVADRLVEYERKRTPHESFDELCRSAILRWQRDNR
jgi:hypothetical protein